MGLIEITYNFLCWVKVNSCLRLGWWVLSWVQRSAEKFFCFAKHHPGSARQKYTQPGKQNLADLSTAERFQDSLPNWSNKGAFGEGAKGGVCFDAETLRRHLPEIGPPLAQAISVADAEVSGAGRPEKAWRRMGETERERGRHRAIPAYILFNILAGRIINGPQSTAEQSSFLILFCSLEPSCFKYMFAFLTLTTNEISGVDISV